MAQLLWRVKKCAALERWPCTQVSDIGQKELGDIIIFSTAVHLPPELIVIVSTYDIPSFTSKSKLLMIILLCVFMTT